LQNAPGSRNLANLIAGSGGASSSSTGVGLANIRNRLAQAYGDDHVFEIRTPAQGGFTVVIEIPYEPAEQVGEVVLPGPAVKPRQAGKAQAEKPIQGKLGLDA
jgi:hypothetical protein